MLPSRASSAVGTWATDTDTATDTDSVTDTVTVTVMAGDQGPAVRCQGSEAVTDADAVADSVSVTDADTVNEARV